MIAEDESEKSEPWKHQLVRRKGGREDLEGDGEGSARIV